MGPGAEVVGGRNRKDNDTTALGTSSSSNIVPSSLRLATTRELEQDEIVPTATVEDSTYGVQSLQEDIDGGPPDTSDKRHPIHEDDEDDGQNSRGATLRPLSETPSRSTTYVDCNHGDNPKTPDSLPYSIPFIPRVPSMPHSLASLSLDSQAPLSSLPSSPKSTSHQSLRPSDEESMDEAASQAVASSSEDEGQPSLDLPDSAPQLIMPSIKMPSRRPFTDRGKAMGRLKILIAGDSGFGKTSLIKSVIQKCEDIVHVDPICSSTPSIDPLGSGTTSQSRQPSSKATQHISEVYASTRPYPSWWCDAENTTILRKRKNMGNTVLERNICFVDTPGYNNSISRIENMDRTLQYIGEQVQKSFSSSPGEGDIVGLLSGSGGTQVDLVFYLISQNVKHEDVVFLQRLTTLTNVITLISKSDDRSPEETEVLRRSISDQLHASDVRQFRFPLDKARQAPFTVCSTPSEDDDNMDASLLMSSEYVQPLKPSELGLLIEQVFQNETASCLRHLAASKLVQAQRRLSATTNPPLSGAFSNPLSTSTAPPASPSLQAMAAQANSGLSPFVQAKIADHTQHEEKLAQIRLAKWAAGLQRSLQHERQKYEMLALGERASWLNQKLHEISEEESGVMKWSEGRHRRRRSGVAYRFGLMDTDDPLGLLHWNDIIVQRGWIALQVAGGFGVLGAIAVWIARTWSNGDREWDWGRWRGA